VELTNEAIEIPVEQTFEELTWEDVWDQIDDEVKDEVADEVADEVVDEVENEANGGNKMRRDQKCTICKGWEYLEPDCPEKKETMRKWRQAIPHQQALTHLWTPLYNLVFRPNTPQKHVKIDDEERQLSGEYYSFPQRPRSCLIPILKMLPLTSLLLIAYLICPDESLSGFHDWIHSLMVYVRKSGEDSVIRDMMK
jgi:hypothetical protein